MLERLRFSPDILARLGEELVQEVDQGIVELAKNAYDADATKCQISLNDVHSEGGSIRIIDDGAGMTADNIRQGWLVIGRSSKQRNLFTPRYRRVPAGDKGLGRLAALRLGKKVSLVTRSENEPGIEHRLVIDWGEFADAEVVEDVTFEVTTVPSKAPSGTEIKISGISTSLSRGTVNRLARSLLLLSDPFAATENLRAVGESDDKRIIDPGFQAILVTEEYADLQQKVDQSYFGDAEYRIHAELDEKNYAVFSILDWKGDTLHQGRSDEPYDAPPFSFDLWVFLLDGQSFSTRNSTLSEVREWLKHVGGVHIYENGLRVPPYGGPGNDWLDLNLRRARSPEMRPSTNTSVGRLRISNLNRSLIQKTDRNGYIENLAFLEMKRCCGDALDWSARIRIREREKARRAEEAAARKQTERGTTRLEKVLDRTVKVTDRKKVDNAIARYMKDTDRETRSLREKLQLYRSLATAGMTSAVFAHEIGRPLDMIDKGIEALQRMIPEEKRSAANSRIGKISAAKLRLNSFVSIPLTMLAKRKRRSGRTNVNSCILDLVNLLNPILDFFKVELETKLTEEYVNINGSEALVDGICLNLVMNSLNAFQRENFAQPERRIRISTEYNGSDVVIRVEDNAGGIDGVEIDDIWLPGVTTSSDGTGFGLTIVRDSVTDLGGSINAIGLTEFGGAEFVVRLPPMRSLVE
jgi:signal transduction histidine kinase